MALDINLEGLPIGKPILYNFRRGGWQDGTMGEEFILLPIKEYYGYQNMLRILHDRAALEVKGFGVDQYGYQFVMSKTCKYNPKKDFEYDGSNTAFSITKNTPYSLNIPPDQVEKLIFRDLKAYYHYIGDESIVYSNFSDYDAECILSYSLKYRNHDSLYDHDIETDNNLDPKSCRYGSIVQKNEGNLILRIDDIRANNAKGVYQVVYTASGTI